jgi:hypothetical protein
MQAQALSYRNRAVIINITQAIMQSISWPVPQMFLLADDLVELPVEPPPACGAEELVEELLGAPEEPLECDNVDEGEEVEDPAEEDGVDASAVVAAAGVGNE